MKILILGDVCGPSGMKVVKDKLREIIKNKNIDFTIVNGENAANNGKGITKENFHTDKQFSLDLVLKFLYFLFCLITLLLVCKLIIVK